MDWPADPFWDYSVELYRRPGVEAACLDLERRHGLDVNLLLLCCWEARRGVPLDRTWLARAGAAAASWHAEVVRPLRALRRRLKARLADPEPDSVVELWPGLASAIREQALALEIEAEHLSQLGLSRAVAGLPESAPPGVEQAAANLRACWPFDYRDRHALRALLAGAFPEAGGRELDDGLAWLEP
jgi:uncharacterized protein (TIGR02444 family)